MFNRTRTDGTNDNIRVKLYICSVFYMYVTSEELIEACHFTINRLIIQVLCHYCCGCRNAYDRWKEEINFYNKNKNKAVIGNICEIMIYRSKNYILMVWFSKNLVLLSLKVTKCQNAWNLPQCRLRTSEQQSIINWLKLGVAFNV